MWILHLWVLVVTGFCLFEISLAGAIGFDCRRQCNNYCPFGRKLDNNGCDTCKCLPRHCPPICTNICHHDQFKHLEKCSSCRCKPMHVPCQRRKKCNVLCPEGHAKDKIGCPTCRCRSKNGGACVALVCKKRCPAGRIENKFGCPTCKCKLKPAKCRPRVCKNKCPNGRRKNRFNCPTCRCNKPGNNRAKPRKRCLRKKKIGPCKGSKLRYFYNKRTKECQMFYWGGCKSNRNNFKTMRQCRKICEK